MIFGIRIINGAQYMKCIEVLLEDALMSGVPMHV